jgi:hypothetical protein
MKTAKKSLKASFAAAAVLCLLLLGGWRAPAASQKISDYPRVGALTNGDLLLVDQVLPGGTSYVTRVITYSNLWGTMRTNPSFFGNVGIGTNNPAYPLHIFRTNSANMSFGNTNGSVTVGVASDGITLYTPDRFMAGSGVYPSGFPDANITRASAGVLWLQKDVQIPGSLTVLSNEFTLVVLPDVQYLENVTNAYKAATAFITNNWNGWTARMLLTEGDLVDSNYRQNYYESNIVGVRAAWHSLSNYPHLKSIGNHDIDYFQLTYGGFGTNLAPYTNAAWFQAAGGHTNAGINAYLLQTNGSHKYLYLTLEAFPTTNAVLWASNLLATYSNHIGILSTHSYLDADGARMDAGGSSGKNSHGATYAAGCDGKAMWHLLRNSGNLALILCGHQVTGKTARRADYGDKGNLVNAIFGNWQMELPGSGYADSNCWVRLLRIRPDLNRVEVETVNAFGGALKTDSENRFSFPLWRTDTLPRHVTALAKSYDEYPAVILNRETNGFTLSQWSLGLNAAGDAELRYGTNQAPQSNAVVQTWNSNGAPSSASSSYDPINDGLVFATSFREGSGSVIRDTVTQAAGTFYTNTYRGGPSLPTWTNGWLGYGLEFRSNYVTFPSRAEWTGLTNLTVSCWFRRLGYSGFGDQILVSKHNTGQGEWYVGITPGNADLLRFMTVTTSGAQTANALLPNYGMTLYDSAWHHALCRYSSGKSNAQVWFDGVCLTNTTQSNVISSATADLTLGDYYNNGNTPFPFNGDLDEVKIWNRALGTNEIALVYGRNVATNFTFTSGLIDIPAVNTTTNVPHGLGRVPGRVHLFFVNTVAEYGYNPGDIVPHVINNNTYSSYGADAANCSYRWLNQIGCYLSRTNNAVVQVDPANWKMRFHATR